MTASWSPGWSAIVGLAIVLAVLCFLAVLWSKREWNSRKIRLGVFLEREYLHDDEHDSADDDTHEWPVQKP